MAISRSSAIPAMVALVFCMVTCDARTHVRITNDLLELKTITVHCKSKDDDLGFHDLSLGSTYEFTFNPNLISSTLFYCSLKWDMNFHYIDAYKVDYNCDDAGCNWKIRDEGACFSAGNGPLHCTVWK